MKLLILFLVFPALSGLSHAGEKEPPPSPAVPAEEAPEKPIRLSMAGSSGGNLTLPARLEKAAPVVYAKIRAAVKQGRPQPAESGLTAEPFIYLKIGDLSGRYWAPGDSCEIAGRICHGEVFRQLSDLEALLTTKGERDQAKIDALLSELEKP